MSQPSSPVPETKMSPTEPPASPAAPSDPPNNETPSNTKNTATILANGADKEETKKAIGTKDREEGVQKEDGNGTKGIGNKDDVKGQGETEPEAEDAKEDEPKPPPPSAVKGKSGRERSTDLKLRFDPAVQVVESPSYVLVMNADEGDDEGEELAIFDRLYEEARIRAERARSAAEKVNDAVANEMGECTFKPVVSASAQHLGKYESWGDFLKSQEDRRKTFQMHFQKKKDKIISDELVPLFDEMPRKHSLKIIAYLEKERKYMGPIKGWRHRFREYMHRLQEQEAASQRGSRVDSVNEAPSVHSGVVRDDAVFERLYEEAIVRESASRVVRMTQLEKESRELYHPMTNESEYWAERGTCDSASLSTRTGGSSVFDELYAMGDAYRRRREERASAAAQEQSFPFRPEINPKSGEIIVARAIARAKGELPERRTRLITEEPVPNAPRRRFNADLFCSRLQRKEVEKAERLATLRRETRLEEASKCTFRPVISRETERIAEHRGYGHMTPHVKGIKQPNKPLAIETHQRPQPHPQPQERGRDSLAMRLSSVRHDESVPTAGDHEVDALTSELQGVLSEWTLAAEEAQTAL